MHSPLIVGMTIAPLVSLGTFICPKAKCSGKFCMHKKTFQSLGRRDYQSPQYSSVCQVRIIPFEDQTKSSLLSLGHENYFFEESPKSIQDDVGDVYCPGNFCSNREKCESIVGYVTTPRSNFVCGNCGAWLFAHKVPFTLQEHVKTTETEKTRFFFAKKYELCTQQTIVN